MRNEDVTFGGSGLNRAAVFRGTEKAKACGRFCDLYSWQNFNGFRKSAVLAKFEFHIRSEGADEIFLELRTVKITLLLIYLLGTN